MDAKHAGQLDAVPDRRRRRWLAALAAVLVVASLVPPADAFERRYLFAESIQFCVFALAAPALAVLGAPWNAAWFRERRLRRLGRPAAVNGSPAAVNGSLAEVNGSPAEANGSPAAVNGSGRRLPSFTAAVCYLIAWVVACVAWRLPPVLDGLARHPVLAVPQAVTLCAAGIGLWLQLAGSPPLAPRLTRPQRAAVAALAMWSIWVIAYILGFARDSVVHAYDGAGSHLVTVADQEITAFVLWAAAAAAFLPVVFTAALTWLRDGSEAAGEHQGSVAEPADGTPAAPVRRVAQVRGWGTPPRGRRP